MKTKRQEESDTFPRLYPALAEKRHDRGRNDFGVANILQNIFQVTAPSNEKDMLHERDTLATL